MEVFLEVYGRRHGLAQALVSGQVNEGRKECKHLSPSVSTALSPHCLCAFPGLLCSSCQVHRETRPGEQAGACKGEE